MNLNGVIIENPTFKQVTEGELGDEIVENDIQVIGFNKDFMVIKLARNIKQLEPLFEYSDIVGMVADNTDFGNVGYMFDSESRTVNETLSPYKSKVKFVKDNLIADSNSIKELEKNMVSNNRFVSRLMQVLNNGNSKLETKIKSTYLDNEDLPMLKVLFVRDRNLEYCVTEQQISLVTGCGIFPIHSVGKDVTPEFVFSLLSEHWGVKFESLEKAFGVVSETRPSSLNLLDL